MDEQRESKSGHEWGRIGGFSPSRCTCPNYFADTPTKFSYRCYSRSSGHYHQSYDYRVLPCGAISKCNSKITINFNFNPSQTLSRNLMKNQSTYGLSSSCSSASLLFFSWKNSSLHLTQTTRSPANSPCKVLCRRNTKMCLLWSYIQLVRSLSPRPLYPDRIENEGILHD